MSTFNTPARALLMLALITTPLLPMNASSAKAATSDEWSRYAAEYTRLAQSSRSSRSSRSEYSSSRTRYSSAIQREIRKLDDDPVEKLPIPILLGVTYKNLTPNFGDPRDGGDRTHEGEDITAPKGAFIVSPTDAVVTRTGKGDSAGIYVYTANPGDETFAYMHLDRIADGVKAGTVLKPGDLIGYVGNTGNAAGGAPHLHFEIREGRKATDPYPRLTGTFTSEQYLSSLKSVLAALIKEQKKLAEEED